MLYFCNGIIFLQRLPPLNRTPAILQNDTCNSKLQEPRVNTKTPVHPRHPITTFFIADPDTRKEKQPNSPPHTHTNARHMKRFTCFVSRNFPRIEKHAMASSSPIGISKQKPMKRTVIRKHRHKKHTNRKDLLFNKVASYLISDSYMYNPLVSPQPTFDFPPPKQLSTFAGGEGDVALPIRGSNKKLTEKVVDFLEADCYLYSPLLTNEHVCSKTRPAATPSSVSGHVKTLGGSESTERQGGQMKHRETETGELHARPVATRAVAYRESLKRIVRQNGALLGTEHEKLSVE